MFNKFILITIIFFNNFCLSINENLINVSFDRIFPETTFEKFHKKIIKIFNLINSFEKSTKSEIEFNDFSNLLFDEFINLQFLIKLAKEEQVKEINFLATDIFFLRNFLNEAHKLFKALFKNNQFTLKKRIICTDYLFDDSKFKLELLMSRTR